MEAETESEKFRNSEEGKVQSSLIKNVRKKHPKKVVDYLLASADAQTEIRNKHNELDNEMKKELKGGGELTDEQKKVYEKLIEKKYGSTRIWDIYKNSNDPETKEKYKHLFPEQNVAGLRKLYLMANPQANSNEYANFIKENNLKNNSQAIIDKYNKKKIDFKNDVLYRLGQKFGVDADVIRAEVSKGKNLTDEEKNKIEQNRYYKQMEVLANLLPIFLQTYSKPSTFAACLTIKN